MTKNQNLPNAIRGDWYFSDGRLTPAAKALLERYNKAGLVPQVSFGKNGKYYVSGYRPKEGT